MASPSETLVGAYIAALLPGGDGAATRLWAMATMAISAAPGQLLGTIDSDMVCQGRCLPSDMRAWTLCSVA
jgi:hypothetical protein